jgi:hypothetical protein
MSWRRAPFDRAADEVVAYVKSTYAPVAIVIEALATHVLGVSTFFAWTSAREPI